jgi:histidyl-tRNA synthetase
LALKYEQRAPQSHALGEVIGIADRIDGNFLKLQDKPLKRFSLRPLLTAPMTRFWPPEEPPQRNRRFEGLL